MSTHVALLRGINVGGKHALPMRDLVRVFEAAGCTSVRTCIQSGNVVFEGSAACARAIPSRVPEAIEREFGFAAPVVLRTPADLRKAMRAHPFKTEHADPKLLMIAFLDRKPSLADVRKLEHERFLPDRFAVSGSEIYLHYPKGAARSKLTNVYLDRALGVVSTVRNWNTVGKLLELCAAP